MAYIQFYYPKRLAFSPVDFEYPGLGGTEAYIVKYVFGVRGYEDRFEWF